MSESTANGDDLGKAAIDHWREQSDDLADPWADLCCECNACVRDCLAAKHGTDFNPREIVLWAGYGLGGKLMFNGSVIQQCFKCNRCFERCPQAIKPVEVINALKEMMSSPS